MSEDITAYSNVLVPLKTFLKSLPLSEVDERIWAKSLHDELQGESPLAVELGATMSAEDVAAMDFRKFIYKAAKKELKAFTDSLHEFPELASWLNYMLTEFSKWGVLDETGKWLIPPQFEGLKAFNEGLACAQRDELWGFIDLQGMWVIKPQFQYAHSFVDGLAHVQQGELWGMIDKQGNWVITPQCEELEFFADGLVSAKQHGLWGFIDRQGRWQIKPTFAESWCEFKNGVVAVQQGEVWGLIDEQGNWVCSPEFESIGEFNEGLASVKKGGLCGLIDSRGKLVIPIVYEDCGWSIQNGCATAKQNGLWGCIDNDGKWSSERRLEHCFANFHDTEGGLPIAPQFDAADELGQVAIELKVDELSKCAGGLAKAKQGDLWGCIDKQGNWAIPPVYEDVTVCSAASECRVIVRKRMFHLPDIESILVSKKSNLTGLPEDDVPFVAFSEDDCFEKQLSQQGRALAELLNEESLDLVQWSSYTY